MIERARSEQFSMERAMSTLFGWLVQFPSPASPTSSATLIVASLMTPAMCYLYSEQWGWGPPVLRARSGQFLAERARSGRFPTEGPMFASSRLIGVMPLHRFLTGAVPLSCFPASVASARSGFSEWGPDGVIRSSETWLACLLSWDNALPPDF